MPRHSLLPILLRKAQTNRTNTKAVSQNLRPHQPYRLKFQRQIF